MNDDPAVILRRCWRCERHLPLTDFYRDRTDRVHGRTHICTVCDREKFREYRANNLEQVRERHRELARKYRQREVEIRDFLNFTANKEIRS